MATLTLVDGQQSRTLMVSARLGIQDAAQLKDLLLEAFQGTDHLILDMTQAEAIDLACVQLVCAAHRTFQKAGKVLELAQPMSAGVLAALADMAIGAACCPSALRDTCVWKHGA